MASRRIIKFFARHKSYFDKGFGELSFVKYFLYAIGLERVISGDLSTTILLGVAYGLFCYFFGWFLFKVGFVEEMREIQNIHNLFVKEIRESERFK